MFDQLTFITIFEFISDVDTIINFIRVNKNSYSLKNSNIFNYLIFDINDYRVKKNNWIKNICVKVDGKKTLKYIFYMKGLQKIIIDFTIDNNDIISLTSLPNLKYLIIKNQNSICDKGLEYLSRINSLEELKNLRKVSIFGLRNINYLGIKYFLKSKIEDINLSISKFKKFECDKIIEKYKKINKNIKIKYFCLRNDHYFV